MQPKRSRTFSAGKHGDNVDLTEPGHPSRTR